jgi:hypothetical protein
MPQQRPAPRHFCRQIKDREHVLGTFIKIPTSSPAVTMRARCATLAPPRFFTQMSGTC